uniref:peroxidase n=1 Tax=Aegilops tauschii subsp. strangulata TaxID=200361 RepID=A0A453MWF9_AEGTS
MPWRRLLRRHHRPRSTGRHGYGTYIQSMTVGTCTAVFWSLTMLGLIGIRTLFLQLGGPSWPVPLGQRDSTTASLNAANSDIPTPDYNLDQLIAAFNKHQLSPRDMTALSGAHTIGYSQCLNFRDHIYNGTNIDPVFATLRKRTCPAQAPNGDTNLAPFDVQTALVFDIAYYSNLVTKRGLLNSDQELFNGGSQDALVSQYATNPALFATDFVAAIIKMSNLSPPPGIPTEIRRNCRVVNS